MAGPLEGIRIVDVTSFITGPLATRILGDQGADVIKVESPGLGDLIRYVGTSRAGISALFATCNRSKRSVVLDLREPRGREILETLVASADVFVQNFRPGVVERLGIDESALRRIRPELVYVSISAFGPTGPYAKKPAYDHVIQAVSGMAALQADPKTETPAFVRNAVADKVTAHTVAQAITAALLAKERSGQGQHLRVSMLDAAIAFLWPDGMMNQTLLEEDVVPTPPISAAYQMGKARDGFLALAALTDAQAKGAFRVWGREDLIDDPRFATVADRWKNLEVLIAEGWEALLAFRRDEVLARFEAEDVPCGPVLTPDELPQHPQVLANETLVVSRHPRLGRMRQPRPAARFDVTPAEIRRPCPGLGEHTDEVLRDTGFSPEEIANLRAEGVVG